MKLVRVTLPDGQLSGLTIAKVKEELLKRLYPNFCKLYRLALCLPVAMATCERSFSAMRRIRNDLRVFMGQDGFYNFSLLNIESDLAAKLDSDAMEATSDRLMYTYKVVLLGEQFVGKSSLALKFVRNEFSDDLEATIGAAFLTKCLSINDFSFKFEIWDTAGAERFHSLAQMYYRNALAAIVAYDITDSKTFDRARSWINELRQKGDPNVLILLVGNKADLERNRSVEQHKAVQYAKEENIMFLETSAKSGMNINEVFYEIGKHCLEKRNRLQNNNRLKQTSVINLTNPSNKHKKCCSKS